jgi:cyclophilin family peptidyl-prolyl cis-trans isomerase
MLLGVVVMAVLIAAPSLFPATTQQASGTPAPDNPQASPTPGRGELQAPEMKLLQNTKYGANIQTAKGNLGVELFSNDVPVAANNLVALARARFYNDATIYQVEPGKWVAMGGLNPDGAGTPGYTIDPDTTAPKLGIGSVAMVLQGGKVSSQFLITTDDTDPGVPYLVVGRITDGLDILRSLSVGDKITTVSITETR